MNKIVLLGRLVKDPDVKYTQSGKCVAQFTIAVDDGWGENKTTSFIPIVVWGKTAEIVGNNLSKGQRALVEGRLQIRSYDAKDGSKRWVTEIIANSVEFIERRSSAGDSTAVVREHCGGSAASSAGAVSPMETFGAAVPFDEEIPF